MAVRLRWIVLGGLLLLVASAAAAEARLYWTTNVPGYTVNDVGTLVFTNRGTTPQSATVSGVGGPVFTTVVAPGTSMRYTLPTPVTGSALGPTGYRVDAQDNLLVTQFNPINNLFTNDAYRLLSYAELGQDHFVFAYATPGPSFLAVVAQQANTQVTVTPTAPTMGGAGAPAMAVGVPTTITMNALDALIVESNGDLTGSRVQANAPIAVFSGAVCTNIGASACDHISEQVLPVDAAGTDYPVCSSTSFRTGLSNDRLRILATAPGPTAVTVTPGAPLTLAGAGSWQEVTIFGDVFVQGSQPIIIAQYYADSAAAGYYGDPAMIIHHAVPMWRGEQQIHIPAGWDDYLMIAAPVGTASTYDGAPVVGWRPLGGSGYQCATITGVADGDHSVQSTMNVSVQVIGVQNAASYWYLGDVGLEAPVPEPCHIAGVAPTAPENFVVNHTSATSLNAMLDWAPPANDGGCPIMGYEVHRQDGTSPAFLLATLTGTPPALPQDWYWDTVPDTCASYRYAVRAWTNVSLGPFTPWEQIVTGAAPQAPVASFVTTESGLRLRWQPPADDGGCPITAYALDGAGSQGSRVREVFGGAVGEHAIEHDLCFGFTFQMQASNVRGTSGWSPAVRYTPDLDNLPQCRPESAQQSDEDGDGVPDQQDNCPFVANPEQGLAEDGACPRSEAAAEEDVPLPSCAAGLGVDDVVAEPGADGSVRIRWRSLPACGPGRVTVWDDGRLVADLPAQVGEQTALDAAATPQTHLYHVQVDPPQTPLLFDEAAAVPSNWIELCAPQPLLAACPVDDTERPDAGPPEPTPQTTPSPATPDGLARAPGTGGVGWWPWLLLAAVAAAVAALLVARRRSDDRGPPPQP